MKNIKIKEMTLSNFKGQNAHHVFGNTNMVSGRNGSGKSTIIKGWNWLICGQPDANVVANDNLFDNRQPITPDTPTASVEAVITIHGEEHTIKRTATASFTRKRGTNEMVKNASDSYKFYVDNIEYSSTEYKDWLSANVCQDDMLKYVLDGSFFVELVFSDKKRARSIIEKTVGTVERSEMKGDYADIDELLEKYSPDIIEEQAKNLSKSIDARLNEIPTVISQKEAEISEIMQTNFPAIQNEIITLEGEQKSIEEKIFDYSARMKPLLEAKAKAEGDKRMKQEVYDKAKNTYMQGLIDQDNNLCAEISRIEKENAEKHEKISSYMRMNATDEKRKAEYVQAIEDLRQERDNIKAEVFVGEEVCPTCGQPLTDAKKVEAILRFEEERSEKLRIVIERGKEVAGWVANIESTINKRNEEIRYIVIEDVEPLKQKLSALRTSDIAPFELTEQGKALQADIDAVVIPEVKMPEVGELKQQAADIKEKLKGLYMKKGLQSRLSSLETDIETLRTEQREKGAELAKYERRRQLVKDFKQEQMEILSLKVNEKLKFSRLDIWNTQKDGSIIPDVIIKNKEGVSFATANNASRLVTIIDIQRFFCECLGVNMPIFLDEASTIDEKNIPHYNNTQIFLLFRADTSLKIDSK